jgi:hypothetical protein
MPSPGLAATPPHAGGVGKGARCGARGRAEDGLLLIPFLLLFAMVTGVVIGGIWLVVWAPQLILVGVVVALGSSLLLALVCTMDRGRR